MKKIFFVWAIILFASLEAKPPYEVEVVLGKEVVPWIDELAQLRVEVFREYPNLYDGTVEYEMKYLNQYIESQRSVAVLLREEGAIIGAITGVPLCETFPDCRDFFVENKLSMDGVFYLGEITLLKEKRGSGLGALMYEVFERYVRDQKIYQQIAFCEVVRSKDDPRRDPEYFCLEGFWGRRGYEKKPNWVTTFCWKEVGEEEEAFYPMVFWTKSLLLAR